MPSSTPRQAKFMRAVAHGWKPPGRKNTPSVAVAREFEKADEAKRGKRSRAHREDRKRATDAWAEGKGKAP